MIAVTVHSTVVMMTVHSIAVTNRITPQPEQPVSQIALKATAHGLAASGRRGPIRAFCNGLLLCRLADIPDGSGVC